MRNQGQIGPEVTRTTGWHKEHIAGATEYYNSCRSEHLIAAKQAQLSLNQCHDDLRVVIDLHVPNSNILLRVGPQNNARLKPVRTA